MRSLATIQRVDHAVSTLCLCHRFSPSIARFSKMVSRTGDGPLYLVTGLVALIYGGSAGQMFLLAGLAAFAIELPVYLTLKRSFRRARPRHLPSFITPSDLYSMPSGHTAAAFLMATLLGHFYPDGSWMYWSWASLIGMSRVLLGVHFVSDIFAGILLGTTSAKLSLSFLLSV